MVPLRSRPVESSEPTVAPTEPTVAPTAPTEPTHLTGPSQQGADPDGGSDEMSVLESLEADLAAVEEAMEGLDRVDPGTLGGTVAAAQVAAVVESDRFDTGR